MIILASKSPRRKELLSQMGYEYECIVSDAEEVTSEKKPEKKVEALAKLKAEDILLKLDLINEKYRNSLIIAADTLVFLGNRHLGKPKDSEDAIRMLSALSDNKHKVITGVSLIKIEDGTVTGRVTFHETTKVTFNKLSLYEIKAYVDTKEPMDKAGAYAIQTGFAKYIKGIEGEYANVVGLPICHLYEEMKKLGY